MRPDREHQQDNPDMRLPKIRVCGVFRRWGATFGAAAVRRRTSAALLRPMLSFLPLQRRVRTVARTLSGGLAEIRLAIEAEPHLTAEDQGEWLDRCDREHANMGKC